MEIKRDWHTAQGFKNREGCFQKPRSFRSPLLKWLISRIFNPPYRIGVDLPSSHILSREEALSIRKKYEHVPSVTWLGHASFLFRMGNIQIITDPLFGNLAYPFMRSFKKLPNVLTARDLGAIDVLLISHEHHDHLHQSSLRTLPEKSHIQPVVPLYLGRKLRSHGFKKPLELDWFESCEMEGIRITAVPAVHYSNFKDNTLWAGFVISYTDTDGAEKKIYFSGDSGYGPFMESDVAPYGPFDTACIGVGGFHMNSPSLSKLAALVHTTPEEAIYSAKEINAQSIIGMHWGTIRMSDEDPNDIYPRMKKHAERIGYKGNILKLRIGETVPL